jgi:hypothetical protein
MVLYHGSNQVINKPDISVGRKFLDFGSGFYLSQDKKQAENRAKSTMLFFENGIATISVFDFKQSTAQNLNIQIFPTANTEWLDFVISNRGGLSTKKYDIVIGPTANDSTILVIDQYMSGMFDNLENPKEIVIKLFQPEKLATQYLFATKNAVKSLVYKEYYTL